MPVVRGSLRSSGDGSIKSFVIILTVIGFLFFIYYKLKISPACADHILEGQSLKIEIERQKSVLQSCNKQVDQMKTDITKTAELEDSKIQELDTARKEAIDATKVLDELKFELLTANEKLAKYTQPKEPTESTCSAIKEEYETEIEELKAQISELKLKAKPLGVSYNKNDIPIKATLAEDLTKGDGDPMVKKINSSLNLPGGKQNVQEISDVDDKVESPKQSTGESTKSNNSGRYLADDRQNLSTGDPAIEGSEIKNEIIPPLKEEGANIKPKMGNSTTLKLPKKLGDMHYENSFRASGRTKGQSQRIPFRSKYQKLEQEQNKLPELSKRTWKIEQTQFTRKDRLSGGDSVPRILKMRKGISDRYEEKGPSENVKTPDDHQDDENEIKKSDGQNVPPPLAEGERVKAKDLNPDDNEVPEDPPEGDVEAK